MNSQVTQKQGWSRRNVLAGSAALLASGAVGAVVTAAAGAATGSEADRAVPPLPWKWVELDPLGVALLQLDRAPVQRPQMSW